MRSCASVLWSTQAPLPISFQWVFPALALGFGQTSTSWASPLKPDPAVFLWASEFIQPIAQTDQPP